VAQYPSPGTRSIDTLVPQEQTISCAGCWASWGRFRWQHAGRAPGDGKTGTRCWNTSVAITRTVS